MISVEEANKGERDWKKDVGVKENKAELKKKVDWGNQARGRGEKEKGKG